MASSPFIISVQQSWADGSRAPENSTASVDTATTVLELKRMVCGRGLTAAETSLKTVIISGRVAPDHALVASSCPKDTTKLFLVHRIRPWDPLDPSDDDSSTATPVPQPPPPPPSPPPPPVPPPPVPAPPAPFVFASPSASRLLVTAPPASARGETEKASAEQNRDHPPEPRQEEQEQRPQKKKRKRKPRTRKNWNRKSASLRRNQAKAETKEGGSRLVRTKGARVGEANDRACLMDALLVVSMMTSTNLSSPELIKKRAENFMLCADTDRYDYF